MPLSTGQLLPRIPQPSKSDFKEASLAIRPIKPPGMTVSQISFALLLAGVNGLVLGSPWTSPRARVLPRLRGGSSETNLNGAEGAQKLVLVTGGAGYIGSHTCLELLKAGERVVVVDNFANSDRESLRRVVELAECPSESLQVKGWIWNE